MSKVFIDRALLERVQERLDPHRDAVLWGAVCDTFHTAPSGTPAMPIKAYYHESTRETGAIHRSVGLEVRKAFIDAPLVLESDALTQIACLEGEIAKRDEELAACRVAVENCEVFRARIAEMQERFDSSAHRTSLIGRLEIENAQLRAELSALAAIKAQDFDPLVCDYCHAETQDPWHGSGMLNGSESHHIHACNQCRNLLPPTKAQGVVMPDVNAAAKALCNRHAMICGIDADDQWKEYSQDFIADAETVLANARLTAAPVSSGNPEKCSYQDDQRSPAELSLAGCNCVRFGECNPHWPCKLHTPAADAGLVEALDYQALFDAIAAATSVYANGAINISVQAFRESLAAHSAKGVPSAKS